MCNSKPADPVAPPAQPLPSPVPTPMPSDVSPQSTAGQRRAQISALKWGSTSTIKTSPGGITGAGPDLSNTNAQGTQKKVLGA